MGSEDSSALRKYIPSTLPCRGCKEKDPIRAHKSVQFAKYRQQIPRSPLRDVLPVLSNAKRLDGNIPEQKQQADSMLVDEKGTD